MGCLVSKPIVQGAASNLPNVRIINKTGKTIELRDRDREVYGVVRYRVEPDKEQDVIVDLRNAGTYYRMAVLVVAGQPERIEPTSPPLFIDTEDLHSSSIITIEQLTDGKYTLKKNPRKEIPGDMY